MRTREVVPRGGLVGLLLVEAHKLARLLIRQRGKQHRLKHTEYRRRAADAQGERDDDDRRETQDCAASVEPRIGDPVSSCSNAPEGREISGRRAPAATA